tara:strand:+ start:420 stop:596 length:177 start_codon:yes stop_codon:yes gene_type:complete
MMAQSNPAIQDHFVDANKMVDIGSETRRTIDDIMLTPYSVEKYLTKNIATLGNEGIEE